ncbi:MAG: hypothetical protein RLZ91_1294 [Bacteroidota bacterium]
MAIELEFINLVVRKSTLEAKYIGGLAQFKTDLPNKSMREDEEFCGRWTGLDLRRVVVLQ